MLVLTRHVGERITIGDNIIVEVIDIQGTQVRLGIKAPTTVSIRRDDANQNCAPDRGSVRTKRSIDR